MTIKRAVLALGLSVFACMTIQAGTLNVGVLSFDTFIPAGAAFSVNLISEQARLQGR